jgi:hypothetical protein
MVSLDGLDLSNPEYIPPGSRTIRVWRSPRGPFMELDFTDREFVGGYRDAPRRATTDPAPLVPPLVPYWRALLDLVSL